jgi:hypothetical protein
MSALAPLAAAFILTDLGLMLLNAVVPTGLTSGRGLFDYDWITLLVMVIIAAVGAIYFFAARPDRKFAAHLHDTLEPTGGRAARIRILRPVANTVAVPRRWTRHSILGASRRGVKKDLCGQLPRRRRRGQGTRLSGWFCATEPEDRMTRRFGDEGFDRGAGLDAEERSGEPVLPQILAEDWPSFRRL